jgi:hypothetical protein
VNGGVRFDWLTSHGERVPLFSAACRVKRNADEYQHNGKHDNGDKGFHCHSLPGVNLTLVVDSAALDRNAD